MTMSEYEKYRKAKQEARYWHKKYLELLRKTEWIPVDEEPPEEDGFYMATMDGEICGEEEPFCGMAEFKRGRWVEDEPDYKCVLAWMPLPEIYRKSEG